MKTKDFIKQLIEAGCELVRNGSRHDIWYSPITDKKFQVPRHGSKEIPSGTESKIRKDSGVLKSQSKIRKDSEDLKS